MDKSSSSKPPTRQALLDAALEVFLERGFAKATTREIAHRAGLSEGTMYRHFADKYQLFHHVFFSLMLEMGAELARLPERGGQETVRDNLAHVFSVVGQMGSKLSSMMASTWADRDLARSFETFAQEQTPTGFERPEPVALVAKYIEAEQRRGRIRSDIDPGQAAAVIVSIPFASGMERALWASFGPDRTIERPEDFPLPGEDALDILARGLAP
jgi:AcrR family transcriptional regulator